ncbi:MAG: recombinase RecX, partial [Cryomorphaceae bacterium]
MDYNRKYPPFETRERIMKWCAMQERAHFDADNKLRSWGVPEDEREQIIAELITDNFLNEERHARAF